jgi:hypothetical protein
MIEKSNGSMLTGKLEYLRPPVIKGGIMRSVTIIFSVSFLPAGEESPPEDTLLSHGSIKLETTLGQLQLQNS